MEASMKKSNRIDQEYIYDIFWSTKDETCSKNKVKNKEIYIWGWMTIVIQFFTPYFFLNIFNIYKK